MTKNFLLSSDLEDQYFNVLQEVFTSNGPKKKPGKQGEKDSSAAKDNS